MRPATEKDMVKQALSAHAAIGLLASALLYIVCVTGTVLVFYEEWQRVEQRGVPEMATISPEAVQAGVNQLLASEAKPTTHLYVHLPTDALPRTTVTTDTQAAHIDAQGRVAMAEEIAWSDFLYALHYTLNLPALIGITLVGVLGVMMLALSLTGVLAHPRIFRDAFRLRARSPGGVGLTDWHNRLSVWTLPFGIAIALTGAVIGLGSLGAYGLAAKYYGGDLEAAYAPIFGDEAEPNPTAAPPPDVAAPLRHMAAHFPGVEPYYLVLHDPATVGQHVQVIADHPKRLIYGENYNFDARGNYHGKAGLSDGATGQQVAASTYRLHFGDYGGLTVKIAYFVFGLALTAVCATGTFIWLGKRRRRGIAEPRLAAAWDAIVWGTPLALVVTFAARQILGNGAPLVAIFWGTLAIALVAALTAGGRMRIGAVLRKLLIVGIVSTGAGVAIGG
jgi:uncharacterized iron-regulated membrane protein